MDVSGSNLELVAPGSGAFNAGTLSPLMSG
jgi:hypothetical protein